MISININTDGNLHLCKVSDAARRFFLQENIINGSFCPICQGYSKESNTYESLNVRYYCTNCLTLTHQRQGQLSMV
jgi:hypothetical protein